MNREETIALWERCEVARADAQARGKTQEQAAMAFTSVWNAKMEELTATRDRLSEREWFMFGQVDFSNVLFQQEGSRLSDEINQGVYRIVKYRGLLSFSNLNFPGLVRFDRAMF